MRQRLLSLTPPEKRLDGLAPDQVARALAGLGTDQLLLVMPDEVLRGLTADFIDGLPEPTRSAVRKRLGR